MINVGRENGEIQTARMKLEVLDAESVQLSTMVVDFTGYGGFKIVVTPKVGDGAKKSLVICTGSSSRKRQEVIDEALVCAMAPTDDQNDISQQVQAFLSEYLGQQKATS